MTKGFYDIIDEGDGDEKAAVEEEEIITNQDFDDKAFHEKNYYLEDKPQS